MKKSFFLIPLILCIIAFSFLTLSCSNLHQDKTVSCSISLYGDPYKALSAYEKGSVSEEIRYFAELKITGNKEITANRTYQNLEAIKTDVIVIEGLNVGVTYTLTLNIYIQNKVTGSSVCLYAATGSLRLIPGKNDIELKLKELTGIADISINQFEKPELELQTLYDSDSENRQITGYKIILKNDYPEGTVISWKLNGKTVEPDENGKTVTIIFNITDLEFTGLNRIYVEVFNNNNEPVSAAIEFSVEQSDN